MREKSKRTGTCNMRTGFEFQLSQLTWILFMDSPDLEDNERERERVEVDDKCILNIVRMDEKNLLHNRIEMRIYLFIQI